MSSFTPFQLEDFYNKYEGLYEKNLSSATMPVLSLAQIIDLYDESGQEEILESLLESKLDYSSQYGQSDIREALVENLYPKLAVDEFLVCSGASEAIFLVMQNLFQAGDKIIVQKPIYQSLYQIAQDKGVEIIDWQVRLENQHWQIDELEELVKKHPETKALIINNPNNPIGTAFSKEKLERIGKILDGRYLISDEVFQPLSLKNTPAAIDVYQHAISISDLSKSFSLPGLRLGWIACSDQVLLEKFSSYKNYLSLRNATLSEMLAPLAIDYADEILLNNKEILRANIEELYQINTKDLFFDLKISKKEIAGLCIFPQLKEEFQNLNAENLVEEKNILLALGDNFGKQYKGFCRIGLGNFDADALSL